jgi:hypothetical protein|tara:strand:+ start:35 stop:364 length:330 start_codon:yes stop_codon:yes gene_type:complete
MAKILNTALPFANSETVGKDIFNKAIRLIELNLNAYDPSATPQFTNQSISELQFNSGDIIWNLSINALQVFNGTEFYDISTPPTAGLSATPSVGTVQVITNGSITVEVS